MDSYYSGTTLGMAATGSDDNKVIITSSTDVLYTFTSHANNIVDINFSGDGKKIGSADSAGKIKIWDPTNGSIFKTA